MSTLGWWKLLLPHPQPLLSLLPPLLPHWTSPCQQDSMCLGSTEMSVDTREAHRHIEDQDGSKTGWLPVVRRVSGYYPQGSPSLWRTGPQVRVWGVRSCIENSLLLCNPGRLWPPKSSCLSLLGIVEIIPMEKIKRLDNNSGCRMFLMITRENIEMCPGLVRSTDPATCFVTSWLCDFDKKIAFLCVSLLTYRAKTLTATLSCIGSVMNYLWWKCFKHKMSNAESRQWEVQFLSLIYHHRNPWRKQHFLWVLTRGQLSLRVHVQE